MRAALLAGALLLSSCGLTSYLLPGSVELQGSVQSETTPSGERFWLYLPPGYEAGEERFTVLYHLHGALARWSWVRSDVNWIAEQHERAVREGTSAPLIIVAPHDPHGMAMWSDSKDGKNMRATELVAGLIPHVDATWRTKAEREGRLLQGFSMGGFGAGLLATKHQELFAAAVIWDGAMHDWETLRTRRANIARDQFSDDEAYFQDWSPWASAAQAEPGRTPFMVLTGDQGDFNDRYTAHLEALGLTVTRKRSSCGHDLKCLERTFGQEVMRFLARNSS